MVQTSDDVPCDSREPRVPGTKEHIRGRGRLRSLETGALGAIMLCAAIPCLGFEAGLPFESRRDEQPGKQAIPYPREGSLDVILKWTRKEFERIAWEKHTGGCVVHVAQTPDILHREDWIALEDRTVLELGAGIASERWAALQLVELFVQIAGERPQDGFPIPGEFFDAVAGRLADDDLQVRRFAPGILSNVAGVLNRSQDAVPLLLIATRDPDAQTHRWAIGAIQMIGFSVFPPGDCFGPHAPAVVDAMLAFADDPDGMTILTALSVVGLTGEAGHTAVPRLTEFLRSENRLKRMGSSMALEHLGPIAIGSLPTLIERLATGDERDRSRAAIVIGAIGPAAASAVPVLIAALDDPAEGVPWGAARALMEIGPPAVAALPRLDSALEKDPEAFGGFARPAADSIRGLPVPDALFRQHRGE